MSRSDGGLERKKELEKMKKIKYILFASVILLSSCKREANVKLPATKSHPVIYGYICPDDTVIRIKVTQSQPLFETSTTDIYAPVMDANVSLSGQQGNAQLVYNPLTEYYEIKATSYSINLGATYKVMVIMSNGEIATAETQVPLSAVPISTITVETITEKYGTYDLLKVYFNDVVGQNNYYRMAMVYAQTFPFQPDTTYGDANVNELYSDVTHDGEYSLISTRYYPPFDTILFNDVYLFNCSPSYFNYHKSLLNYSGDNPFAEPSLTYTNVKGGFGCFGAYTRSRFRYKK